MGTVPELGRQILGGGYVVDIEADGAGLAERLALIPGVTGVENAETGLVVFTDGRAGLLPEIVGVAGDNLKDISVSETTLESVFIKLTGRDLRD